MKKGAPLSAVGDSSALSTLWIADVASTPGDLLPAVEVRTLRSQPIAGSSVIGSHRGDRVAGNEFTPPFQPVVWAFSTRSATSPSNPKPRNLFFQLVSARYERASLIVTSNIIALKRDSYRLKNRDLGRAPSPTDD